MVNAERETRNARPWNPEEDDMEAIESLRQQHRELLSIFDELELTTDALERTRLLGQVAERLKTHAAVEEEVFYPAVRALGAEAKEVVEEALAAHRAADLVLDESLGAEPTEANVKVLRDVIQRHVDDEEQRMFPLAERLGATAQARLAARIERRADELEGDEGDEGRLLSRRPSE
jgi:hemerythrin-like domain-containing protein